MDQCASFEFISFHLIGVYPPLPSLALTKFDRHRQDGPITGQTSPAIGQTSPAIKEESSDGDEVVFTREVTGVEKFPGLNAQKVLAPSGRAV